MKIKRALALVVIVCITVCTLSACNADPQKSIEGKWYDSSGKCLDIRSDGTYKLDNDYGTGRWKFLDDGETIEFTDFYGSTLETKVGTESKKQYIILGNYGKFYNKSTENNANAENNTTSTKTITYSTLLAGKGNSFHNGKALVEYKDTTGKICAALIDTNGKILYNVENARAFDIIEPYMKFKPSFADIGCIEVMGENSNTITEFQIINQDGKLVKSSLDGEFDKILACGDGLALVYKDKSDVNGRHNFYGVINASGKWEQPLIEIEASTKACYVGCGIFQIRGGTNNVLLNSNTGKFSVLNGKRSYQDYFIELHFINNIAFYYSNDNNQISSIDTNFEIKNMDSYNQKKGPYIIKNDPEHLVFYSPISLKTIELQQYSANQVIDMTFFEKFTLITLNGKDGHDYFTVLNESGEELFAPIRCISSDVEFAGEYIAFRKDYSIYSVVNLQGNIIADNLNYEKIYAFNGDIAVAAINKGGCFINLKGEKILTTFHK